VDPTGTGRTIGMNAPGPGSAALSVPTVRVHTSFLAAIAQFRAEGRGEPGDDSVLGQQLRRYGGQWNTPDGFADHVTDLRAEALPDTPRPEGIVASTDLWWISGSSYLGRVSVRHTLTDRLRDSGGHIGYDVVPSARRQGHATAMLAAALRVAADLGITSALLTHVPTNEASRRVIERNGGILDSADERVLRYWIPTSSTR
jgi:predicted acetyltransferase